MIHGSCLCQSITFTISGDLRSARFCHCNHCTTFAGTSPATWAMADSSNLAVTSPDPRISKFDSGRGLRCFCSTCGAPVWFESKDYPDIVAIPLGALDTGDIPAPEMHLWVQSKRGWCSILDDLPQHQADPGT